MSALFTYTEAKLALIDALNREASLHEEGKFAELGANFDEVDEKLPRDAGPEFRKLLLAHEFWAGWLDSCEHDWFFYEPIHESDWPTLAKQLVADIAADRESTDPVMLKHFAPRPKSQSWFSRVKELFQAGSEK